MNTWKVRITFEKEFLWIGARQLHWDTENTVVADGVVISFPRAIREIEPNPTTCNYKEGKERSNFEN